MSRDVMPVLCHESTFVPSASREAACLERHSDEVREQAAGRTR